MVETDACPLTYQCFAIHKIRNDTFPMEVVNLYALLIMKGIL